MESADLVMLWSFPARPLPTSQSGFRKSQKNDSSCQVRSDRLDVRGIYDLL